MFLIMFYKLFNANSTAFLFFRSSHPEVFCKKGALRNFAKFIGKRLWQSLFCRPQAEKETLVQLLSCEFCEISKSAFSYRTTPAAASAFFKCLFVTSRTPHFTLFTSISTLLRSSFSVFNFVSRRFFFKKKKKKKKMKKEKRISQIQQNSISVITRFPIKN